MLLSVRGGIYLSGSDVHVLVAFFVTVTGAAHGLPTETEGVVDTLASIVLEDREVLDKLLLRADKKKRNGGASNGS